MSGKSPLDGSYTNMPALTRIGYDLNVVSSYESYTGPSDWLIHVREVVQELLKFRAGRMVNGEGAAFGRALQSGVLPSG